MRIGIFTDQYYPSVSGLVTSIKMLYEGLEAMGHECFIFTSFNEKKIKPEDKEELYKYWLDAGYKNNGRFTKEHTSVTIDERDGKYVYTEYFFYKQGCYSCSKVSWNRTTIEKTISNQDLGKMIQENMDAFIGRDYKKSDGKYIWNGSTWVKRKEYLNL